MRRPKSLVGVTSMTRLALRGLIVLSAFGLVLFVLKTLSAAPLAEPPPAGERILQHIMRVADKAAHKVYKLPIPTKYAFEKDPDPPQPDAPTIFLSLSSYRDDYCNSTIASAFEQARNPDKLYVGVFMQWNNETDVDCVDFSHLCPGSHAICARLSHLTSDRVDYHEAAGPTPGRYRADSMMDGQDFHLQVDAHTLFTPNWDFEAVTMWRAIDNEYAVITSYPKQLEYLSTWSPNREFRVYPLCRTGWGQDHTKSGMPMHGGEVVANPDPKKRPMLTTFWGAGLSFSKAHRVLKAPNDPYLQMLFHGEELELGVRMWTHGYDLYAPAKDFLYHMYNPYKRDGKPRVRFWELGNTAKIAARSAARVMHKFGQDYNKDHTPDLRELDRFGMGKNRKVADFWTYTKIDYPNRKMESNCPLVTKLKMPKHAFDIPPEKDVVVMDLPEGYDPMQGMDPKNKLS